jgi:hypothetical protein
MQRGAFRQQVQIIPVTAPESNAGFIITILYRYQNIWYPMLGLSNGVPRFGATRLVQSCASEISHCRSYS